MIVLLSGGQDSVTSLFWAMRQGPVTACVSFRYGQRHSVELDCAAKIARSLGLRHEVFDVAALAQIGGSALTRRDGSEFADQGGVVPSVPTSFVPGRNAVFFALAAGFGATLGDTRLVSGVCQTDYSGYPDCRRAFVDAQAQALSLALSRDVEIWTPLMTKTKAETFALAQDLGVLDRVVEETHTCYQGSRDTRHDWGYGCGDCPACRLRATGWKEFLQSRPAPR